MSFMRLWCAVAEGPATEPEPSTFKQIKMVSSKQVVVLIRETRKGRRLRMGKNIPIL